jgi:hypothetical protein
MIDRYEAHVNNLEHVKSLFKRLEKKRVEKSCNLYFFSWRSWRLGGLNFFLEPPRRQGRQEKNKTLFLSNLLNKIYSGWVNALLCVADNRCAGGVRACRCPYVHACAIDHADGLSASHARC